MVDGNAELGFSCNEDVEVVSECFRDMGYSYIANRVHTEGKNRDILKEYISILSNTAIQIKHSDVLERLQFAGLVYG